MKYIKDQKLSNLVLHARKVVSDEICDRVLEDTKKFEWRRGTFYNYGKNVDAAYDKNSILDQQIIEDLEFRAVIEQWQPRYLEKIGYVPSLKKFTNPKVNRYQPGGHMRQHVDHIHSIFDGELKGIPIMTTVGLLNDDFEGGEFCLWDDYIPDLKKGDILAFPSVFLYPHQVKEVTKGIRYSWISWWY